MNTILYWIAAVILSALLGFGGGYIARGDCAKEVRATEATATASASVKAEKTNTKFEVKNAKRKAWQGDLIGKLDALPPVAPPPVMCGAPGLDDDDLRLWNAGNQGDYGALQQGRVDAARPEQPSPAQE